MNIAALIKEIEGLKAMQMGMEARIKELEAGGASAAPTLSDAEKVLFIQEAVRRDRMGDDSMVKVWNRGQRAARMKEEIVAFEDSKRLRWAAWKRDCPEAV